jgi:hypothetical protein
MNGASAPAHQFALFVLSAEGQRTLAMPARSAAPAAANCPGVRKSVRLDLDASPLMLQFSGVAADTIAVTIGTMQPSDQGTFGNRHE